MRRVICALLAVALVAALPLGVYAADYPEHADDGNLDGTLTQPRVEHYNQDAYWMHFSARGGQNLLLTQTDLYDSNKNNAVYLRYEGEARPGDIISLECTGELTPNSWIGKDDVTIEMYDSKGIVAEETGKLTANLSYNVQQGDKSIRFRGTFEHAQTLVVDIYYKVVQPSNNAPTSHPSHPPGSCWLCGGEDSTVRFSDLYGEVSVRCDDDEDDGYEYAELDMPLYINDRIRTREESGAILEFMNMSTFVMRPESIVILERHKKTDKFKLIMGKFWINLKKAVTHGVIDIEMSQAAASIKGTVLSFEETGDTSTVWLFTSSTDVTSKTTGEVLTLAPGQKATVTANYPITVEAFDIEEVATAFGIPMQTIEADRQENGYLDTEGIDGIVDIEADAAAGKPEDYGNYIPDGAKDDSVLYFAVGLLFILLVLAALVTVVLLVVRAAGKRKQDGQPGAPYHNPAPPWQQPPPQNAGPLLPAPQRQYCPRCGVPYRPGAKFCNNCGGLLQ